MTHALNKNPGTWGGTAFIRIPSGNFIMGSSDDDALAWDDEKPQHVFDIPYDYWIAKIPVTNEQYKCFTEATSYKTRAEQEGWCWVWQTSEEKWLKVEGANWKHPMGPGSTIVDRLDHPVVQVCYYDALAYCEWFNQIYAKDLSPGYEVRIPTEAEWEKAARGLDGLKWVWGNTFNAALCNSRESGRLNIVPVKSYSPQGDSPYGVADMSGNIWEWTITLWGMDKDQPEFIYPYVKDDGRENQNADEQVYRIIRGGSFKDDQKGVRCACRDLDPPAFSLCNLGFRLIAVPDAQ